MMPSTGGPVCLGTSPNHQAPAAPVGPPAGLNGGPRNAPDGLLMTANPQQQQPPNGSAGGYYGMDSTPQQPLNVQPGGGPQGPAATTSPTGGGDAANANNSVSGGQSQGAPGGQSNGYLQQQTNSATAAQTYSTTGQGTWTGSNTLTYTQAMQPDMQRQQGNYCKCPRGDQCEGFPIVKLLLLLQGAMASQRYRAMCRPHRAICR